MRAVIASLAWRKLLPGVARFWSGPALLVLVAGCPLPNPGGGTKTDGTVGVNPADYPGLRVLGEPNDTFDQALTVILDGTGNATIEGNLSSSSDIDIFDLGPSQIGDRIRIDVRADTRGLDAAFAVFDDQERILFENDDRNLELNQLDPYFHSDIRRETTATYLAITSSPLGPSSGNYHALITVRRGQEPVAGETQTVVLDFDGGSVTIPGDRTYTVDVFDAGDITSSYAGRTEEVITGVTERVRKNYEGLGLEVRVVPGDVLPTGCTFSRVLFGGRSPTAFGISEGVDTMNLNRCDDAIVFTETFTPSNFGRLLTVEELGVAMGNVAAHEVGHLLGLNHVTDVTDLMDSTGSPMTFVADQEFKLSPLEESIFPIGFQDGWLLLMEILGAAP